MNKAIRLVVIEDKKLLLVRKRDSWILPGGKPNEDEGGLECLLREIKRKRLSEIFTIHLQVLYLIKKIHGQK